MILRNLCFLALLPAIALATSAQESETRAERLVELARQHVQCQDKTVNVPAANSEQYLNIQTSRVCVPTSFAPAYDEGVEADCLVEFTIKGNGVPHIESSVCNTGFHGDFEVPADGDQKLGIAKYVYQAVAAQAAVGWRYEIANDLEAENLGKMQLPFEFLVREEGPHTFEPVEPNARDVGPGYAAGDLVDAPDKPEVSE